MKGQKALEAGYLRLKPLIVTGAGNDGRDIAGKDSSAKADQDRLAIQFVGAKASYKVTHSHGTYIRSNVDSMSDGDVKKVVAALDGERARRMAELTEMIRFAAPDVYLDVLDGNTLGKTSSKDEYGQPEDQAVTMIRLAGDSFMKRILPVLGRAPSWLGDVKLTLGGMDVWITPTGAMSSVMNARSDTPKHYFHEAILILRRARSTMTHAAIVSEGMRTLHDMKHVVDKDF